MKKIESQLTLSEQIEAAILKDLAEAYEYASYESFDHHAALDTLQELGIDAMPNTQLVVKKLRRMEDNPTMLNYDRWGLPRPFGLSSLSRQNGIE
jgi:hypothetical protein